MKKNDLLNEIITLLERGEFRKVANIISKYNCDKLSGNLLCYFTTSGDFDVIQFLLINKFNPNKRSSQRQLLPLCLAAQSNNVKIGNLLIKYGANMYMESAINKFDFPPYACPFFIAIERAHIEFMDLLLENGFKLFYMDSHGKYFGSFFPSNETKKNNITKYLKEKKLPIKEVEPIKNLCLFPRLSKEKNLQLSFYNYCESHLFDFAQLLLKNNQKIISRWLFQHKILIEFIKTNNIETVNFLLKNEFNLLKQNHSRPYLHYAILYDVDIKMFHLLIKFGENIDEPTSFFTDESEIKETSLFFYSIYLGRIKAINFFLANGFDINYKDVCGRSLNMFLPKSGEDRKKILKVLNCNIGKHGKNK